MRARRKPSTVYKRNRKIALKKQLKRVSIYFLSLIFLSTIIGAIYYCRTIDLFPITNVRLFVNQQYIDTTQLKQLVSRELKGNFFTLSLTPIIQTLLSNDQIKTVSIQRVWPRSLSIYIDGYEPVAFYNNDSVITADGYTFKTPKNLTTKPNVYLKGPINQAKEMMQRLHAFDKILQPLNLTVKKFVTDSELYLITLNNGLNLTLGTRDLDQRLERFTKLYSKVIGRCEANVESVDLRYSNGLAVRWNDQGKCIKE